MPADGIRYFNVLGAVFLEFVGSAEPVLAVDVESVCVVMLNEESDGLGKGTETSEDGEVPPTYCVEVILFEVGFATEDGTLMDDVKEACGESNEPLIWSILQGVSWKDSPNQMLWRSAPECGREGDIRI
jgi:hypothetical protein